MPWGALWHGGWQCSTQSGKRSILVRRLYQHEWGRWQHLEQRDECDSGTRGIPYITFWGLKRDCKILQDGVCRGIRPIATRTYQLSVCATFIRAITYVWYQTRWNDCQLIAVLITACVHAHLHLPGSQQGVLSGAYDKPQRMAKTLRYGAGSLCCSRQKV